MPDITYSTFKKEYAEDFKRLNLEWIEKYFEVENHDLEQLSNPREYIIEKGGEILYIMYENAVVGVCALVRTRENEFELAKMAVSPGFQGKQIGYKLGLYTIETARSMGAKKIWLESNRILGPAISLYKKLGFYEVPLTVTPYLRADIKMEMVLK